MCAASAADATLARERQEDVTKPRAQSAVAERSIDQTPRAASFRALTFTSNCTEGALERLKQNCDRYFCIYRRREENGVHALQKAAQIASASG